MLHPSGKVFKSNKLAFLCPIRSQTARQVNSKFQKMLAAWYHILRGRGGGGGERRV